MADAGGPHVPSPQGGQDNQDNQNPPPNQNSPPNPDENSDLSMTYFG